MELKEKLQEIEKRLERIEEEIQDSKAYTYGVGVVTACISALAVVFAYYTSAFFAGYDIPFWGGIIWLISTVLIVVFILRLDSMVERFANKKRRKDKRKRANLKR